MDRFDFAYGVHFLNGAIVMFFVIASLGDDPLTAFPNFLEAFFGSILGGFPLLLVFLALFAAGVISTLINLSCRRLLVLGALQIGILVSVIGIFLASVVSFSNAFVSILFLVSVIGIIVSLRFNISILFLVSKIGIFLAVPSTFVSFLIGTYGVLSLYFSIHWFFFERKKTPT